MSEIKLPEPAAYRLTDAAFRTPVFEYHTTKERAENRQADFNRSVDDGGLHNLTELFTADQLRAAVQLDRAGREPAEQPVLAYMVEETTHGPMLFFDKAEALTYCYDEDEPIELVQKSAPAEQQAQRRPLTDAQILKIAGDPMSSPCSPWWLKGDVIAGDVQNAALAFARAIEHIHGIGEQAQREDGV